MKKISILTLTAILLVGCGKTSVTDYATMDKSQKEAFMANYQKDMEKIYSGANKLGGIKTTIQANADTDTITNTMTYDGTTKGMNKKMVTELGKSLAKSNCTEKYLREFVDAGITYRMVMKDSAGRLMVNMTISPETCAKL